jgi:leader peptidase (prepilin peptidase)/N-methyltransferase
MVWVLIIAFALVMGSFLNVVIHRLPRNESIVRPRSRCPHCEKPIAGYDNIPVLSYLWLRGRCRNCGQAISALYPAVELITAALVAVVVLRYGLRPVLAPYLLMTFILVAVTMIDLQLQIIPDKITLPAWVLFVVLAAVGWAVPALQWPIGIWDALLGSLIGAGVIASIMLLYYWASGKEGMGMGDLKFLGMAGALVGWKGVFLILMLGSFAGTLFALPLMLSGKAGRQTAIPFGPFLAVGTFVTMLYGRELIELYQAGMAGGYQP